MRLLKFYSVASLLAAFLSGYFVRNFELEGHSTNEVKIAKNNSLASIQPVRQNKLLINPDITKISQQSRKSQNNNYINSLPNPICQLAEIPEQLPDDINDNRSTEELAWELLGSIGSLASLDKTYDEIRDGKEFQQLLSLLSADPVARNLVLEQFLQVSGTPLGKTLSLALGQSRGDTELPQIKEAAVRLLRDGSAEQRINALQMLGHSSQDKDTRPMVLDILRNESQVNPEMAIAAMSTLSRQGIASQTDQQEVVSAVAPLIHSQDSQVRQNSLQLLAQWAGHDKSTLQTFTEATYDASPEVRSLALATLGRGGFDYNNVRDPLLSALQNPNEDQNVKAAALQALEGFPLDAQAFEIYQAHLSSTLYQQPEIEAN